MSETEPTPPRQGEMTTADLEALGATPLRKTDPPSIGPYRLLARLGGGGMGRLYLGRNTDETGPQRARALVAIKVIRPEYAEDAKFRARFEREVEAVRRVHSAYTAGLLGSGFDDDERLWMATAYVPGLSLSDAVQHFGPLPPPAVWRLASEIGQALGAIGAAGIVHRDLKPSNVLLGTDGVRVIDFGVAHTADTSALTSTGQQIGTPAFMSPEQAAGRETGPASDVFSLGSVLALSLTGTGPFGQGSTADVIHRVVYSPPSESVLAEVARYDPDLARLVSRCLEKDPDHRPSPDEIAGIARQHAFAPEWPQPVNEVIVSRTDWCGATAALSPMDQLTILRRPAPKESPRQKESGRRPLVLVCSIVAVVAVAATAFVLYGPMGHGDDRARGDVAVASSTRPSASASASASPTFHRSGAGHTAKPRATPGATVTVPVAGAPAGGSGGAAPPPGRQAPVTVTAAPPKATPTKKSEPWKSCTYYSGSALTQYGDTGSRVKEVQCILRARGYSLGSHGMDGVFGADTRTAVKSFQKSRHLTVDGQVGADTWAVLRD